jgi:hypothetical protein
LTPARNTGGRCWILGLNARPAAPAGGVGGGWPVAAGEDRGTEAEGSSMPPRVRPGEDTHASMITSGLIAARLQKAVP